MQDIELARISQEVAERFYNLVAVGEGGRCPSRVKDGPILSQARSRSKGPLSDQVADATKPRRQCRSWVEPCRCRRAEYSPLSGLKQTVLVAPLDLIVRDCRDLSSVAAVLDECCVPYCPVSGGCRALSRCSRCRSLAKVKFASFRGIADDRHRSTGATIAHAACFIGAASTSDSSSGFRREKITGRIGATAAL